MGARSRSAGLVKMVTMLLVSVALAMVSSLALAQPDANSNKSTGPVIVLPGVAADAPEAAIHLPGREYRAGDGWWILKCAARCELHPARLSVKPKPHPVYDGDPVPGQLLTFSSLHAKGSLLMFKPSRGASDKLKLRAGPVTTYYPGGANRLRHPAGSPGSMEGEIALPNGKQVRLVPTVILPRESTPRSRNENAGDDGAGLTLELQFEGKRQVLGSFNFGIEASRSLEPSDYVLWAGDLDGDGRPDLLVNLDFSGTNVVLLLSSLAHDGQIAGEAGRFQYFPIDSPGC